MRLKQFVIIATAAVLSWFGISQGTRFAQAYANQQKTFSQVASLVNEIGDPNQAPNLDALKQSQTKLQGTISGLEAIPNFPGFESDRAKTELARLRPLFEAVSARIQREEQASADLAAALKFDSEAAEMVKNSPHPAEVWQQARERWQQAITLLDKIPATSFVSTQAKTGLEACRINFKIADTQWMAESQAFKEVDRVIASVEQAKKAIQTRPYQLVELLNARTQWQRSLERLNKIAETTTVYSDAQLLATSHQTNIRKLDEAITQIRNCQGRYQLTEVDSTSTSLCGYDVSLDLENPIDILTAQAEPEVDGAEFFDDTDVTIVSVPDPSTGFYSRYRQRRSSSFRGSSGSSTTWVRGYTRSDGTSVRGHHRGGARVSGMGSSRSGGASS